MPSKKKKYNARFPPARIKKIMQTDEEIGKVAAAVPVIICILFATVCVCVCVRVYVCVCVRVCLRNASDESSLAEASARALELFLESLLTKACQVTHSRNAKTMTTSHLKQCIELEQQFDFLKDLVAAVPDMQGEGEENHNEAVGEKVSRRGRKPGPGRKNGGTGAKGKDKKLSGTDSEQEDDSEDSETDGDEEDSSQSSTKLQAASRFNSSTSSPQAHVPMGNMVSVGNAMAPVHPQGNMAFLPHPSMMSVAPPAAAAPNKNEDDDEDYDS